MTSERNSQSSRSSSSSSGHSSSSGDTDYDDDDDCDVNEKETVVSYYQIGDRVVLHNLEKAKHLNGMHGFVASLPVDVDDDYHHRESFSCGGSCGDRYGIDLDLVHPSVRCRLMTKPTNLMHESSLRQQQQQRHNSDDCRDDESTLDDNNNNIDDDDNDNDDDLPTNYHFTVSTHRANIAGNGVLAEEEGRPLCLLLDSVRFLVGKIILNDPDIQNGLQDIERLRQQKSFHGQLAMNNLVQTAWTYWTDAAESCTTITTTTSDRKSVFQLLCQFFEDLPQANGCDLEDMPQEFRNAQAALSHRTAVLGWQLRIQGDFWIVGCDDQSGDGGTFLVSNYNRHAVYKVFGLRRSLMELMESSSFDQRPLLVKLTSIPWYGRLVYDGVVLPAHGRSEPPEKADTKLACELRQAVALAREEGRVVERLRQLEYPRATLRASFPTAASIHVQCTNVVKGQTTPRQNPTDSPTSEEQVLMRHLTSLPVSADEKSCWCLRRKGYTEFENPEHVGLVISAVGGGIPLGPFSCSALVPTATDVFQALVKTVASTDHRANNYELPAVILVDDLGCCERVQRLLAGCNGFTLKTKYYQPPLSSCVQEKEKGDYTTNDIC